MADKEEKSRIYILKVPVCKDKQTQEQNWEKCRCYINDTGFCKHHPECRHSLTRQEAIDKIKKDLDIFLENLKKNKDKVMPWYTTQDLAEVAINALLEGVKK